MQIYWILIKQQCKNYNNFILNSSDTEVGTTQQQQRQQTEKNQQLQQLQRQFNFLYKLKWWVVFYCKCLM